MTTSRFRGYDRIEYGNLIVNRKETEIVRLTFDMKTKETIQGKTKGKYLEKRGPNSYFHCTESGPLASKIVCGKYNKIFARNDGAVRELIARYDSAVRGTR